MISKFIINIFLVCKLLVNKCYRSTCVGLTICFDYWWSLLGLTEDSEDYEEAISYVHQRSADRILAGCLANGGLYIKLGQGFVSMDHVLPREFTTTLKVLIIIIHVLLTYVCGKFNLFSLVVMKEVSVLISRCIFLEVSFQASFQYFINNFIETCN